MDVLTKEEQQILSGKDKQQTRDFIKSRPDLHDNREVMLFAIKHNIYLIQYASPTLKADRSFIIDMVRHNGNILFFTPDNIKRDKEIVLIAVNQIGYALRHVLDLKADKEVVLTAVHNKGMSLTFASQHLKADKEVVVTAVRQDGGALQYASANLKTDKEVVLAAVSQDGIALQYASANLKADKEVVLAAVKQNGVALKYASADLKRNPRILFHAIIHGHEATMEEYESAKQYADKVETLVLMGVGQTPALTEKHHRTETVSLANLDPVTKWALLEDIGEYADISIDDFPKARGFGGTKRRQGRKKTRKNK